MYSTCTEYLCVCVFNVCIYTCLRLARVVLAEEEAAFLAERRQQGVQVLRESGHADLIMHTRMYTLIRMNARVRVCVHALLCDLEFRRRGG